jgi:heme/copper-type cytochrome/quinol oxidase subunit 1
MFQADETQNTSTAESRKALVAIYLQTFNSKMKVAISFLIIGIALLTLVLYPGVIRSDSKTVDIHLHDTYFIIDTLHLVIALGLVLLTLFGLGGVIGTGFKNKTFLLTFFIALVLNGLFCWWIYNQFYER